MEQSNAQSQPQTMELPLNVGPEDAARLLAERRNAPASTEPKASVETPVPKHAPESTEQSEQVADAETGLLDEAYEETSDDAELDASQPDYEEEESDVDQTTVIIDGEEVDLDTVREWQSGYMKDRDYRQKTEALASERKHFEQSTQDLENLAQMYAFRLGEIDSEVNSELEQFKAVNWPELAKQDPTQYTAVRAQYDAVMQRKQEVNGRMQEFLQKQEQMRTGFQQRRAQQAKAELKQRIPEWNDALYYKLIDFGVDTYKFDRDAALKWTDPSTFEALRDAMRYREGQKVVTKKKVATAPKKTLKPRATQPRPPQKVQEANRSVDRLKESGKIDDAVAAFINRREARGAAR